MPCINYAHRGASELYPENTLYSFYMGLEMGADGIETDIQRTKDGVLVLFHDDTLNRILGTDGTISDYTYNQLLQMDFGIHKGERFKGEKILTLEEFLIHFSAKPLTLALEIKQTGIEKETLAMLNKYHAADKVIVTSFLWDALIEMRKLDQNIRIGYLTENVTSDLLKTLAAVPMQQICPHCDRFTDDLLLEARSLGLSIRFWGVKTEEQMLKCAKRDADGMTINNPSLLTEALKRLNV